MGAPHVIDPSRLLKSAARLYGDEMETLWGEVAPVPEERVTILKGGEEVEGLDVHYAPGHARHHVLYHDPESGDAYTGDVAGVSVPPSDLAAAPTPPPEIEVEVWLESLQMLRSLEPKRICMTHFGWKDDAEGQIARVEAWLKDAAEESSTTIRIALRSGSMRASTPRARRSPSACARRCRPTSSGRGSSATGESAARRHQKPKTRRERPRARPCQTASFAAGECLHL